MSTGPKVFKKGELLYKEGDKIQNLLVIQSGSASQVLVRGKKNIEIYKLGASQVLGEGGVLGSGQHLTSAIANSETTVLEVPAESLRQQTEALSPLMKMFVKSLIDRLKVATTDARSFKSTSESTPCPEEVVAQVFGAIFIAATLRGEKVEKSTEIVLDWNFFRTYAQRVLGQSPKRLEQALNIMVKLKAARYEMGDAPKEGNAPPELVRVYLNNLPAIEAFVEFYQYYVYKPRRGDILKYDEFCAQLLTLFVEEGAKTTPDRYGVVGVNFYEFSNIVQQKLGTAFTNDHFVRLESRGILCKRREITGVGIRIEFELTEYQNMLFGWKILRELDKWNEKGFVDIEEKEEPKVKKSDTGCPQCSAETGPKAKFCPECGTKLVARAA